MGSGYQPDATVTITVRVPGEKDWHYQLAASGLRPARKANPDLHVELLSRDVPRAVTALMSHLESLKEQA